MEGTPDPVRLRKRQCSESVYYAERRELQEGARAEIGFELLLHAEFPWKGGSTPELRAKATEIRESSPSSLTRSFRRIPRKHDSTSRLSGARSGSRAREVFPR